MHRIAGLLVGLCGLLGLGVASAQPLVLQPTQVSPGVYVVVADLGPPSHANEGLNANLGFVVGRDGVGVVDSGPSVRVAEALHAAIRRVTALPIRWVVNTNSQPNRWLGNAYFRGLGIPLWAHPAAVEVMRQAGSQQLDAARRTLGERAAGTTLALPEPLSAGRLDLAGERIEARHFGTAHTPGDVVVWMPARQVAFAGDIAYTDRLPAVLPVGSSKHWITAFDRLAALQPHVLIPGHGAVRPLATARHHTRDYLQHVRNALRAAAEASQPFDDALTHVDAGDYATLANFQLLWRPNAFQIYVELEREAFD